MDDLKTQSPAVLKLESVRAVISKSVTEAKSSILNAMTPELYRALNELQAETSTHGEYLQALNDLKEANKAITKKDIEAGQKTAFQNAPIDNAHNELRDGLESWPEPVNGAELYKIIKDLLNRHCSLPAGADEAITLWVMGAYSINSFRVWPKLLLHSPQKRCGKTTLLEVLTSLLPRTLIGSNITPSVIFRAIEKWSVSVLMDEVDTFIHGSDDLRGIINSGHTRATAFVWRTEGDVDREPVQYSTWAPMVLAMIGSPPDTILDRSIKVRLERKPSGMKLERIPQSLFEDNQALRRKLQRWADDNNRSLQTSIPTMPEHSNDRALDNWLALFRVADVVSDSASKVANKTMAELEKDDDGEPDLSIELLQDISDLIASGWFSTNRFSRDIVGRLNEMDDRPWPDCNYGRPLNANRMARLLKPYGIKPQTIRASDGRLKGYGKDQFKRAAERYLSRDKRDSVTCPSSSIFQSHGCHDGTVTAKSVTDAKPTVVTLQPTSDLICHGVTAVMAVLKTDSSNVTTDLELDEVEL